VSVLLRFFDDGGKIFVGHLTQTLQFVVSGPERRTHVRPILAGVQVVEFRVRGRVPVLRNGCASGIRGMKLFFLPSHRW
jgi:hypothetical protein